jgi:hypothetical protein
MKKNKNKKSLQRGEKTKKQNKPTKGKNEGEL